MQLNFTHAIQNNDVLQTMGITKLIAWFINYSGIEYKLFAVFLNRKGDGVSKSNYVVIHTVCPTDIEPTSRPLTICPTDIGPTS